MISKDELDKAMDYMNRNPKWVEELKPMEQALLAVATAKYNETIVPLVLKTMMKDPKETFIIKL